MDIDDPMRFESHRLQTFRRLKWPSWSLISCEKLAKAGFYYTGLGDEVICYSCGGKRRGWKMGEKAIAIHSAMFPLCAFVRKVPECGNVPLTNFRAANTTTTTGAVPTAPNPLPQAAAVESDSIEIATEETVGAEVETAAEAMEVGSQVAEESVISQPPTDHQYDVDVSNGPGPLRTASAAANSLSHDGISSSTSASNNVSSSPILISSDSDAEFDSAGTRNQAMIGRRPKRPMTEPGGVTPRPIRRPTPVPPPVVPQVSTPTFDQSPNPNFQQSVGRAVTEPHGTPTLTRQPRIPNATIQQSNPIQRLAERYGIARRLQTARRGGGRLSSSRVVAESEMAPASDTPVSVGSPRATHRVPIGEWPEPTSYPLPLPLTPSVSLSLAQLDAETQAFFRSVGFGTSVASMQRDAVAGKQLDDMNIYTDVPRRPDMASYPSRLETFTNRTWPMDKSQQPGDMASVGFYCTGNPDSDYPDEVKCFQCGVTLHHWRITDDPWIEHVRWSKRCQFVLMNKGKQFWESVKIRYKSDSQSTSVSVENRHSATTATTTAVTKANSGGPQTFSDLVSRGLDTLAEQIIQALSFGYEEKTIVGAIADNGWQLFPSILELIDRIEAIRDRAENFPSTSSQSNGNSTPNFTTLSEAYQYLREQRLCKICMDNEVSVVFLPCGHLVSCPQCAWALQLCPICRERVRGSVRSFVA